MVGVFRKGHVRILHIPVLASGVAHGIEGALVGLLDERLEHDPHLVGRQLLIPLFKVPLVEATPQEQPNCIVEWLHGGVGAIPECLNLLAILNTVEEYFWCIQWEVHTAKQCVVLEDCNGSWAAMTGCQLFEDLLDLHGGVPPG